MQVGKNLVLVLAIKLSYLEDYARVAGFNWTESEDLFSALQHLTSLGLQEQHIKSPWKEPNNCVTPLH